MNLTIYTPLDPTLIGGMRTWLESFWLPIVRSGELALRIVHTGTRPAAGANAYLALPPAPWTVVEVPGRAMPGTGARLPRVSDLANAFDGSDIVYIDNGYLFQDAVALKAARRAGARAVSGHHSVILHDGATAEGLLHNAAWTLCGRRLVPRFDAVHALNTSDARYLQRCGARATAAIALPVDRTVFAPGTKNVDFTVLFAGRFHRQKGVDRLVRFVQHHRLQNPGARYRIAGAGPQEERLRDLARCGGVTVLSGLTRERIAQEMRSAHVLIAPSRTETFGFAAAESLASGTPVICSATHGFCDLVDGTNGTIVGRPDDPQAWSDAVEALRRNPQRYAQFANRARLSTESLAFDRIAQKMLSFLSATATGGARC